MTEAEARNVKNAHAEQKQLNEPCGRWKGAAGNVPLNSWHVHADTPTPSSGPQGKQFGKHAHI